MASASPLLCLEDEVRPHERVGRAAPEGIGAENTKLKKLLAGQPDARDRRDARGAQARVTAVAARLEVVRQLLGRSLRERQALTLVVMGASTLRHQPRDDGNGRLCYRRLNTPRIG
jgi:hypothetical protein